MIFNHKTHFLGLLLLYYGLPLSTTTAAKIFFYFTIIETWKLDRRLIYTPPLGLVWMSTHAIEHIEQAKGVFKAVFFLRVCTLVFELSPVPGIFSFHPVFASFVFYSSRDKEKTSLPSFFASLGFYTTFYKIIKFPLPTETVFCL